MEEKSSDIAEKKGKWIKGLLSSIRKNGYAWIGIAILLIPIFFFIFNHIYNAELSSKQAIIESQNQMLANDSLYLKQKDDIISTLRYQLLTNTIKNNALNISIHNSNLQDSVLGNWSCSEKDIIISEFAQKITNQDESLKLCINDSNEKSIRIQNLESEIPAYNTGFVGKVISVAQGSSFQADDGKFILAVMNTQAIAFGDKYQTTFKINGVQYTKSLGDQVVFGYNGSNYTLNLQNTANPAKFFIVKS